MAKAGPGTGTRATPLRVVQGADGDVDLVARFLAGDASAAAQLYRRHARRIAGIVHRLGGPDAVDDVVQEAFAEAFGSLRKLREPERFASWLGVIAVRKAKRHVARMLGAPQKRAALLQSLVEAGSGVSEEVIDAYRCLVRLPPRIYVAWMLRRVEGFTIAETAELCRVGTTTVKRWVARGDRQVAELGRQGGAP
jgi:RNA polymerase sigma-70 factor (ECF subfamily)